VTSAGANDIEFRSVSKRYGEVLAVSDVDLKVPKGAASSSPATARCLSMAGQ
jgi:ABC-type sugar transport system ATPase subunit